MNTASAACAPERDPILKRRTANRIVEDRSTQFDPAIILWRVAKWGREEPSREWGVLQTCCQGPPDSHLRSGAFSEAEEGSTGMTNA
jgi:hypothetical protein